MCFMMLGGIVSLIFVYMFSQFYCVFLVVLMLVLYQELGVGLDDLVISFGLWFVVFVVMQLLIGWVLDRFGLCYIVLLLLVIGGVGGVVIFVMVQVFWYIYVVMVLLGIGCVLVMIGSFFIFVCILFFGMMSVVGGIVVGFGLLGNIFGVLFLVWVVGQFGWCMMLIGLLLVMLVVVLLIFVVVKNFVLFEGNYFKFLLVELWKVCELWFILLLLVIIYVGLVCIWGLWVGLYLLQVFGVSDQLIGWVILGMGFVMVSVNLLVGCVVWFFGLDWCILIVNNMLFCVVFVMLWLVLGLSFGLLVVLLVMICILDSFYLLMMLYGCVFLLLYLVGWGIMLLNMILIVGVGVMQFILCLVYQMVLVCYVLVGVYSYIFLLFLVLLLIGLVFYLFSFEDCYV